MATDIAQEGGGTDRQSGSGYISEQGFVIKLEEFELPPRAGDLTPRA